VIILVDYDTDAYDADGVVSPGFAEVKHLMPLLTPFTLEDNTSNGAYYAIAHSRVYQDAPGITGLDAAIAMCWYIAYLISGTDGTRVITSEKIGNSSWSYGDQTESDGYLAKYEMAIQKYVNNDMASVYATGVIHEDAEECSSDVIPYWGLSND
jgi:hypothetical protein